VTPIFNFSWTKTLWGTIAVVFLLGLILRVMAMDSRPSWSTTNATRWQPARFTPYLENDEKIYIALTEQLDTGKGYTLQGHRILREPWIVREQYDRPLFFHPPGGIAFFWLIHRIVGNTGYALAQILGFAIFFWSALLLGWVVLQPFNRIALLTLAVLAAFTPIMAHVAGRFWLDGPLLAFSTAAVAVFLLGLKRRSTLLVCLAAALLGYASLIKLAAFLVIPGAAALAWAVTPRGQRRSLIARGLLFVGIAGLIQLPWEIWQWRVVGSAFPTLAGKPVEQLVRTNRYVFYLTVVRSPWVYVELLPQVIWTLVPSLVLLAMQWSNRELRKRGAALVFWIVLVVGIHVALGAIGYSKVLRYVILVTPATVVLFALIVGGAVQVIHEGGWLPGGKVVTIALLLLATAGLGLEVIQGLKTSMADNRMMDLIRPLPVLREIFY
jgi:4-amino-4-deoxy-L-arabinose transferase-like glycosyltransferase